VASGSIGGNLPCLPNRLSITGEEDGNDPTHTQQTRCAAAFNNSTSNTRVESVLKRAAHYKRSRRCKSGPQHGSLNSCRQQGSCKQQGSLADLLHACRWQTPCPPCRTWRAGRSVTARQTACQTLCSHCWGRQDLDTTASHQVLCQSSANKTRTKPLVMMPALASQRPDGDDVPFDVQHMRWSSAATAAQYVLYTMQETIIVE
jgi:hypothetical protein